MHRMTALIVVDTFCSDDTIRHYLSSMPTTGVHASLLVVSLAPSLPMWAHGSAPYGPLVYPNSWDKSYQAAGHAVTNRANQIEQLLQKAGISGDVTTAYCEAPMLGEKIADRASLCDIVLMDPEMSKTHQTFRLALEGVLFQTPIAAVLNAKSIEPVIHARRPMIAWDASLPATRALHRALPILRQSEQVTILVVDPNPDGREGQNPGSDVATWLTRHGCNVTVKQSPRAGKDIGHCILDSTMEIGADLIVMGAYVHSRARQRIFGGTTQIMVEQKDHQTLMAH